MGNGESLWADVSATSTRRYRVTWIDNRDAKRHSRSYVHRKSAETRVSKLAAWPAFFAAITVERRG